MERVQYLAGRYRLIERLGAGGMSVVWRAHDEVLRRPVAVKLLAPRLLADPAARRRIRDEARTAARLNHPHITDVYDYGESGSGPGAAPFVVMELVDGVSLAQRLDDGALPWRFAVEVCAQVATALAAVHARALVHRDVKPANIMLTGSGAKLVDFGISAVAGDRCDIPEQVMGTPAYLAPERLDGGPADAASDVYALGLVLYRALAGRLPWDAATTIQMLVAHCHTDPAPLPPIAGLPDQVVEVCRQSLAKRPSARPTAAEMGDVLAAVATGSPVAVPARPPTREEIAVAGRGGLRAGRGRAVAPLRRRARAAWALAGLLLAVAAPVGVAAYGDERPPVAAAAAQGGGSAPPESDCRVEYRTTADTGGRFEVALTVQNTGTAALPRWTLAFRFPGDQRLLSVAGAAHTQDAGNVVLAADTPLPAGTAATVTLAGTYGAANPMPTTFALAGQRCTGQLVGAAVPPPVSPPPAADPGDDRRAGPNSGPGPERQGRPREERRRQEQEQEQEMTNLQRTAGGRGRR